MTVASTLPIPPKLTEQGMMRAALEEDFFQSIQGFYRQSAQHPEPADSYITSSIPGSTPCMMTQLPAQYINQLHAMLQPLAEAWVGQSLTPTYVYGIRSYQKGAILRVHRDRAVTHVVSAILNVDQKTDIPWNLLLQSEAGSRWPWRNITMAPRDLVFYEGGRLLHGRPAAFQGTYFANCFIHFALAKT
jgi:prolyl 4-hydroxylase